MILYYSEIKQVLTQLAADITASFGTTEKHLGFEDRNQLLDYLNANKNVDILIVHLQSIQELDFLEEISEANNFTKILLGKSEVLLKAQSELKNTSSIQYLATPLTKTSMELAILSAQNHFRQQKQLAKLKEEFADLSEELENKVADRLKALIESDTAKNKFFSIIAHDLKSPFNALIGISEMLVNEWQHFSETEKYDFVKDLHSTSVNAFDLLDTLLIWSKNQKDKFEVLPRDVVVGKIIDSSIKIAEKSAKRKNIKIQSQIDNKLEVLADENMLATVFRNLISNAVQYIPNGSEITITSETKGDYCTFCVADNGEGISTPFLLKLFKKETSGKQISNNGLGLILCKEFVENNGGRIWLESDASTGSKFFFTIPKKNN